MAYPVFYNHPLKAIYVLLAILFEATQFPFWVLRNAIPSLRYNRNWSFRQAMMVRLVYAFLKHSSACHAITLEKLTPGREGSRFVVLDPASEKLLTGLAVDKTSVIKPVKFGATWTKTPLQRSMAKDDDVDVCLHFHGGAFVIGNGRDEDTGFLAKTLIRKAKFSHVLTPQYRLASNLNGHFPAALQDAIASYSHLLNLGVPASRITISGDSAGGNLALCLLRYIKEHGSTVGLPWPAAVLLWSPWINLTQAADRAQVANSPHYNTDYIPPGFGAWGAEVYSQHNSTLMASPYLSPLNHPFSSKSPIFIQTGSAEVLYHDNIEFAEAMEKQQGNTVKLVIEDNCPHDIILTGPIIGFIKEAEHAAVISGEFVRGNRLVEGNSKL